MTTSDSKETNQAKPIVPILNPCQIDSLKQSDKELENYRRTIERLARSNSTEVFSNGQPAHAAIIFDVFLRTAKKQVLIFCEKLCDKVYDDPRLVNALDVAIRNQVSIKVVTQTSPCPSGFLTKLKELAATTKMVSIRDASDQGAIKEIKSNFAVMDDRAYRFEPLKDDCSAVACMNNPSSAESLTSLFDRIFAVTPPLKA